MSCANEDLVLPIKLSTIATQWCAAVLKKKLAACEEHTAIRQQEIAALEAKLAKYRERWTKSVRDHEALDAAVAHWETVKHNCSATATVEFEEQKRILAANLAAFEEKCAGMYVRFPEWDYLEAFLRKMDSKNKK
ncbi:hypothetical protein SLS59_008675 [Nothophoma quercina]|uniref:Uncharacterized protein n=1 Tax=Nothophoma quercina TaxID=749835 RepID=A0ABR3QRU0_9PLEO